MMEVLTNPIVVNISQYIRVANHVIIYLKCTQLCANYISIKMEKKVTSPESLPRCSDNTGLPVTSFPISLLSLQCLSI